MSASVTKACPVHRFVVLCLCLLGWLPATAAAAVAHPMIPTMTGQGSRSIEAQSKETTNAPLPSTIDDESNPAAQPSSAGWQRWIAQAIGLPMAPKGSDTVSQFAITTELLGPLTPLALSPYFGITVLSGMTQVPDSWPFGGWLNDNALLGKNPVLRHPITFWIFLLLTVATSLPRFTKVTKPIAQALDWIESYSGLLTSLVIMGIGLAIARTAPQPAEVVAQAGVLTLAYNGLLLVAAIINFLVVKSVRFLFEILIWISPIPFVDACFEICNKALCFVLLCLYAFSPFLAMLLNLSIFLACLLVLNWARRRLNYHFHLWLEPWVQWLFPGYRKFDGHNLWVFCEQDFPPFRKYDRLHLYCWDDQWYLMRYDLFWKKRFRTFTHDDLPMLESGPLKNALVLQQQVPVRFVFHRGYTPFLDDIAQGLGISTKQKVDYRAEKKIREAQQGSDSTGEPEPDPGI